MREDSLVRANGMMLIAAALFIAVWLAWQPYAPLTSDVVGGSRWIGAHTLHLVGAVFLLVGIGGVGLAMRPHAGAPTEAVNALALVSAGFFLFTGVLTAVVMPIAAHAAPALYGADGAFANPPFVLSIIVSILLAVVSFVLLGVVMIRSNRFPRPAAALLIVGILFALAPIDGSVPPPLVASGQLLWPAGLLWTGISLARPRAAP